MDISLPPGTATNHDWSYLWDPKTSSSLGAVVKSGIAETGKLFSEAGANIGQAAHIHSIEDNSLAAYKFYDNYINESYKEHPTASSIGTWVGALASAAGTTPVGNLEGTVGQVALKNAGIGSISGLMTALGTTTNKTDRQLYTRLGAGVAGGEVIGSGLALGAGSAYRGLQGYVASNADKLTTAGLVKIGNGILQNARGVGLGSYYGSRAGVFQGETSFVDGSENKFGTPSEPPTLPAVLSSSALKAFGSSPF